MEDTSGDMAPLSERPCDPVQMVNERLADAAGDLSDAAAILRRAIAEGTVPPTATPRLAAYLEDLAARMRRGTPETPTADVPDFGDGERK